MGQATITGGGPTGLYDIQIVKHAGTSAARLVKIAARLVELGDNHGSPPVSGLLVTAEAEVSAAQNALSAAQYTLSVLLIQYEVGSVKREVVTAATKAIVECEMTLLKKQRDLSFLQVEKTSLTQEQTRLNAAMAAEPRSNIWCTDLTEDLAVGATVGTMEMNGEDSEIILTPGGVSSTGLGKLQHAGISTPAAVFYNKAIMPCWQKWKPTYRIGKILKITNSLDTCDVGIEDQRSCEQGLKINQAGIEWSVIKAAESGWDDFCALNPTFALVTNTDDTTITNTAALQADLKSVNSEVNDASRYIKDVDQYGKLENWALMEVGGSGDCEDFALTKAKKLLDLGYPASAIHIEVGLLPNGEGHAWLVVQTSTGDIALDINYKDPISNGATPYTDRKRQTGTSWDGKGVELKDVEIEYMNGLNSDVFEVNDMVVVQFVGQDWTKPKVIGFETNPRGIYYTSMLAVFRCNAVTPAYRAIELYSYDAGTLTLRKAIPFNPVNDHFTNGQSLAQGLTWSASEQKFIMSSLVCIVPVSTNLEWIAALRLCIYKIGLDGTVTHDEYAFNNPYYSTPPGYLNVNIYGSLDYPLHAMHNSYDLNASRTDVDDNIFHMMRTCGTPMASWGAPYFDMKRFNPDVTPLGGTISSISGLRYRTKEGAYIYFNDVAGGTSGPTWASVTTCHHIQAGKTYPLSSPPEQDFLWTYGRTFSSAYGNYVWGLQEIRRTRIPISDLVSDALINIASYSYETVGTYYDCSNRGGLAYLSEHDVYFWVNNLIVSNLPRGHVWQCNASGAPASILFDDYNFQYVDNVAEALVSTRTIKEQGWTL